MRIPSLTQYLVATFLLAATLSFASNSGSLKKSLLLAKTYPENSTLLISDYWVSEKLDGVRAYWDGSRLISRGGHLFSAPTWFTQDFPAVALDGELWIARERFADVSGTVRKKIPDEEAWKQVHYWVFELPNHAGTFDQRVESIQNWANTLNIPWLHAVKQNKLNNNDELFTLLNSTVQQGGEGLMLHLGSSYYHTGRSKHLLKLKPSLDAEAKVIEVLPGKGQFTGMMGSLRLQLDSGKTFKLGTGFTHDERASPPSIGTYITYEYSGLTKYGLPRFARYKRIKVNH